MQSPTIAWKYRFIQVPATQSGSLPLPHECNSFVKCMQSFNVAGTTFTCSLCDVPLSGEDFSSGNSILLMKIRAVKHPSARGRAFVLASFFCKFQRRSAASILSETLNFSQNERGIKMYYSSYFDRNPDALPDIARALEKQNEKMDGLIEQVQRLCDIMEKMEKGDNKPVSAGTSILSSRVIT